MFELFEYLSYFQKIWTFKRFDFGELLNISHICKRFRHLKDLNPILCESFKCFEYPADFTLCKRLNSVFSRRNIEHFEYSANFIFSKRFRHSKNSTFGYALDICDVSKTLRPLKNSTLMNILNSSHIYESFKCFEYPANFTFFVKDSNIQLIRVFQIFLLTSFFCKRFNCGVSFEYF